MASTLIGPKPVAVITPVTLIPPPSIVVAAPTLKDVVEVIPVTLRLRTLT